MAISDKLFLANNREKRIAENKISDKLLREIAGCRKCDSLAPYLKFPPDSHGNRESKYILVSEAPGTRSLNLQPPKYWMGRSGKLLRSCGYDHSIELEDLFYLTDIVKCWPSGNRTPKSSEISTCLPFLNKELEELKPRLILSLGNKSSRALLGKHIEITRDHGQIYPFKDTLVLLMIHPSYLGRSKQTISTQEYKVQMSSVMGNLIKDDIELIPEVFASKF